MLFGFRIKIHFKQTIYGNRNRRILFRDLKNGTETKLIQVISKAPKSSHYYLKVDNKNYIFRRIYASYESYMSDGVWYVVEHLPKEYVMSLLREQKLERIINEN